MPLQGTGGQTPHFSTPGQYYPWRAPFRQAPEGQWPQALPPSKWGSPQQASPSTAAFIAGAQEAPFRGPWTAPTRPPQKELRPPNGEGIHASAIAAPDSAGNSAVAEKPFYFLKSPPKKLRSANSRRALDLFKGSGNITRHVQGLGFKVMSLDVAPAAKADICADILDWDYKVLPPPFFHDYFSRCALHRIFNSQDDRGQGYQSADKIVLRTLKIIEYFHPEIWWVENPRGGFTQGPQFYAGNSIFEC